MVQQEEETHKARLDAIRKDLEFRDTQPTLTAAEFDVAVDIMLAEKRLAWLGKDKV